MNLLKQYGNIVLSLVCILLWGAYDAAGIHDPSLLLAIQLLMGGGIGHYFGTKTSTSVDAIK